MLNNRFFTFILVLMSLATGLLYVREAKEEGFRIEIRFERLGDKRSPSPVKTIRKK